MSVRPPIPESYTVGRVDWPRLVARRVNDHERDISGLLAGGGGGGGLSLDLDGGDAAGVSGSSFDFDGGGA